MADGLGLGDDGDGRATAFGDFDLDGDTDIVLSRYRRTNALYMNELGDKKNFIAFRLQGTSQNRAGIGAIITVMGDGHKSAQQVTVGSGFSSQSSTEKIFGIGDLESVTEVSVLWPSGERERFGSFSKNQRHLLMKGSGLKEAASENERTKDPVDSKMWVVGLAAALTLLVGALVIIARRRRRRP